MGSLSTEFMVQRADPTNFAGDRRWFSLARSSSNVVSFLRKYSYIHRPADPTMKKLLTLIGFALLVACSGDDAPTDVAEPEPANNPLAEEQAFMKEAAKVQDILDKDAAEKKKAIEDAN